MTFHDSHIKKRGDEIIVSASFFKTRLKILFPHILPVQRATAKRRHDKRLAVERLPSLQMLQTIRILQEDLH